MSRRESLAPAAQLGLLRIETDGGIAFLLAGLALGLGLAVRLLWPFDGLYGQDAFAYFRYARALWPWLLHGSPLPIYYWPAGYPLIVALVLPLAGWGSASGQAVSIVASAAAAGLTYCLSRELLPEAPGGRIAAWVAGLAVALSGSVLRAGLVVMSDALALACCAAAVWSLARSTRTGRYRWLAAAALALAWAIITRWVCGLLAAPLLVFALIARRTTDDGRRTTDDGQSMTLLRGSFPLSSLVLRLRWLVAFAVGALVVVPQLIVSAATPVALAQHQWVEAWSMANAWQRDFTTVDGAQHYVLPVAAFYLAQMAWPSFLATPLALLALPGAIWLVRGRLWAELALLAGWPLTLWLFLSGIPYQNARFVLPALPALAVLAGLGFAWMYAAPVRWRRAALAVGLALALAGGLLTPRILDLMGTP
ncbi:MAG TPA: glycosyltransferase family 39 protein, partial [Roseiflexaceae bacterium]